MSQETRKDPRAKIVSLNVRYKSATVDEFIEDHSFDVSKGGVFIKTATPFATGTLLKFEMRLAGDQAVIAGVGRVVWRREPPDAGGDTPAGMGVKFIKIDEKSRETIDRLIAGHSDAGSAYQQGLANAPPSGRDVPQPPSVSVPPTNISVPPRPGIPRPGANAAVTVPNSFAPVPVGKATATGLGATSTPPTAGNAAAAKGKSTMLGIAPPTSMPPGQGAKGKATMIGLGAANTGLALDDLKSVPPEQGGEPVKTSFFPESKGPEAPVKEPTMMKEAAELLEEAFKEAGGTAGELTNPLFSGKNDSEVPAAASATASTSPAPTAPTSVRPPADSLPPSRKNVVPAPVSSASLLPAAPKNRSMIVGLGVAGVLAVVFAVFAFGGNKDAAKSEGTALKATSQPSGAVSSTTTTATASGVPSTLPAATLSAPIASTATTASAAASAPPASASASTKAAPVVTPKPVVAKPKPTATATATTEPTATGDEEPKPTPKPKASAKPAASAKPDDDNPY